MLSEEIVNAISNAPIGEPLDETELDDELENMQQEQIEERMLKPGPVPVGDQLDRLPAAANGERKFHACPTYLNLYLGIATDVLHSQSQTADRGRRRRGRTRKIKS